MILSLNGAGRLRNRGSPPEVRQGRSEGGSQGESLGWLIFLSVESRTDVRTVRLAMP
ncbi:MAG: hypothetical protein AABZ12_10535 [Planctomycetota bacterium]